jgi:hypothetical protein
MLGDLFHDVWNFGRRLRQCSTAATQVVAVITPLSVPSQQKTCNHWVQHCGIPNASPETKKNALDTPNEKE